MRYAPSTTPTEQRTKWFIASSPDGRVTIQNVQSRQYMSISGLPANGSAIVPSNTPFGWTVQGSGISVDGLFITDFIGQPSVRTTALSIAACIASLMTSFPQLVLTAGPCVRTREVWMYPLTLPRLDLSSETSSGRSGVSLHCLLCTGFGTRLRTCILQLLVSLTEQHSLLWALTSNRCSEFSRTSQRHVCKSCERLATSEDWCNRVLSSLGLISG